MSSWVSCCCTDTGLSSGMHLEWPGSRGWGCFKVWCASTLFCSFLNCCMQAMTHSVGNVPSQQAAKLVVVGPGFVEQCWFGLFLGDQWRWKMEWIGDMALQSVMLTLKFSLIFQTNEENFTFITFKTDFYQMHGSSCFQGCFQFFF